MSWRDCKGDKVVLREDDIKAAEKAYEQSTGKCHACFGIGMRNVGWSCDEGNKYAECNRCKTTGEAN